MSPSLRLLTLLPGFATAERWSSGLGAGLWGEKGPPFKDMQEMTDYFLTAEQQFWALLVIVIWIVVSMSYAIYLVLTSKKEKKKKKKQI